jgi:hypothetical protein
VGYIDWQACCSVFPGEIPHRLTVQLRKPDKFDRLDAALTVLDIRQGSSWDLQIGCDLFLLEAEILASLS